MTSVYWFRFKNTMLIANVISNLVGVAVVFYLFSRTGMLRSTLQGNMYATINCIFIPLSFAIPVAVTLIYERPIRQYLEGKRNGVTASADLTRQVHRRLLNEPFFLIALNALVGDTVNTASRLQDANKQHDTSIIVSAETFQRLSREFPLRILPATNLKGKKERVEIFGL